MLRPYEVLVWGSFNGLDAYRSLGIYVASSRRVAANKALRNLAEDPYDTEGSTIASPDPSIIVLPLRSLLPLEGLTIPQEIIDWYPVMTRTRFPRRRGVDNGDNQ